MAACNDKQRVPDIHYNISTPESPIFIGHNIEHKGDNVVAHGDNCMLTGDHCKIYGTNGFITGNDGRIDGDYGTYRGDRGMVTGLFPCYKGDHGSVEGDSSRVWGDHNIVVGEGGIVFGDHNKVCRGNERNGIPSKAEVEQYFMMYQRHGKIKRQTEEAGQRKRKRTEYEEEKRHAAEVVEDEIISISDGEVDEDVLDGVVDLTADYVEILSELPMVTRLGKVSDEVAAPGTPDKFLCCMCTVNERKVAYIPCGHGACAKCTLTWFDAKPELNTVVCATCDALVPDFTVLY